MRALIRERVNAGLGRARAKDKRLGRPPVPPTVVAKIRELRAHGFGKIKIAKTIGVGTVQRVLA